MPLRTWYAKLNFYFPDLRSHLPRHDTYNVGSLRLEVTGKCDFLLAKRSKNIDSDILFRPSHR